MSLPVIPIKKPTPNFSESVFALGSMFSVAEFLQEWGQDFHGGSKDLPIRQGCDRKEQRDHHDAGHNSPADDREVAVQ